MSSDILTICSESVENIGLAGAEGSFSRYIASVTYKHDSVTIIDTPSVFYIPRTMCRVSDGYGTALDVDNLKERWTFTNDGCEPGAPMTLTELQNLRFSKGDANYVWDLAMTPATYAALSASAQANYRPAIVSFDTYGHKDQINWQAGLGDWVYMFSDPATSSDNVVQDGGTYKLVNFSQTSTSGSNSNYLNLTVNYLILGHVTQSRDDDGLCIGTAYSNASGSARPYYYHPNSYQSTRLTFGGVTARTTENDGDEKVEVVVNAFHDEIGYNQSIGAKTGGVNAFTDGDSTSYSFYASPAVFGNATSASFEESRHTAIGPSQETVGDGKFYYTGPYVTFSSGSDEGGSSGGGEGEGSGSGSVTVSQLQIYVTDSLASNAADQGGSYAQHEYDGKDWYVRLYDPVHQMFVGGLQTHWVMRDPTTGQIVWNGYGASVTLHDAFGPFSIDAENEDTDHDGVIIGITKKQVTPSLKQGQIISKYWDGTTHAVVSYDMFDFDAFLPVDINEETGLYIIPTGTYASAGTKSNTSAQTISVTVEFNLPEHLDKNYELKPSSLTVSGKIYGLANGAEPNNKGYSMKVLSLGTATFQDPPSPQLYDEAGYAVVVAKNGVVLSSNSSATMSWVQITTKNGVSSQKAGLIGNAVTCYDAGEYDCTVYVTDTTDYPNGYVYVGNLVLTILPVINVSWIATSYEG